MVASSSGTVVFLVRANSAAAAGLAWIMVVVVFVVPDAKPLNS